jgi:hypothetical protein
MKSLSGFRLCNFLQEILNACWLLVGSVLSVYSCSTLIEGSYNLVKNGGRGRGPWWGHSGAPMKEKGMYKLAPVLYALLAELETKIKAVFNN